MDYELGMPLMAKNRMVRPEMWTDDKFVGLSPLARLLFVGMWNFACDNGHLDDSALQLKMRVLPADDCDVPELLDELLASGVVTRKDHYLKVVNLSDKQPIDLRFLVLCDHCQDDSESRYSPEDKKPARGSHAGDTRASHVSTTGTLRSGVGGVDVDGVGDGGKRASTRARQLPPDWKPSDGHAAFAAENRLDLEPEAAQFRDHHRARGSTMKDWDAAFRTWLRNAVKWRKDAPAPVRSLPSVHELELPPDGLSPDEYAEWELAQRAKRGRA